MVYFPSNDTFVLYEGEDPIGTGTPEELETVTGISAHMIRYYATPSAQKRANSSGSIKKLIAVRVRAQELA